MTALQFLVEKPNIIEAYRSGETMESIAKRYGVIPMSIARRLRDWGITKPKTSKCKTPALTERDRIQYAAFQAHFKIFSGQYENKPLIAFALAIAATSDTVWDSLSEDKKLLAAKCLKRKVA